jgi:hypothetical protein
MNSETLRGRHLWTLAIVIPLSPAFGDPDYPRGPVPDGGWIFYASFDNGPRADEGAGRLPIRADVDKTGNR